MAKVEAMQKAISEFPDLHLNLSVLKTEGEEYTSGQVVKPGNQYIQLSHSPLTATDSMSQFWKKVDQIAAQAKPAA